MRKRRLLPGVLDVRHPTWDQHEVVGAFAYHLIGDVNVATPSILRLRLHAESLYGYAPGLRETHRELCPGKGVAERGPRIERSYERRAKHHAATAACWLSTLAIFRHPSILRNLICPLATRLNSRISAVSSSAASLAFSRGGETPRGAAPSCSSSVTSSTALCGSAAAFPRRERLASAQLKGAQMFVPVGKDADQAQHGHADHLPGTTHAQGKAIEVDIDHIEGGKRACPPGLQAVLQRGHHKVTSAPPEFSSASQFAAFVSASACSSPELHVHFTVRRRRSLEILAGLRLLPCPAVQLAEAEVAVVDEGGMPSSVASAMAWPKESSACSIGRIDSGRRFAGPTPRRRAARARPAAPAGRV